ncbi:MAG: hypothetical protein ACT4OZ_15175 [Gemmatimonadota bacterium]
MVLALTLCAAQAPGAQSAPQASATRASLIRSPAAGLALSFVALSENQRPASTQKGVAGYVGLRTAPLAWLNWFTKPLFADLDSLEVIPHVSLAATHLQGLSKRGDPYANGYFSFKGVRISYPLLARLKPFVIVRNGKATMERFEAGHGDFVVSYSGTAKTAGLGVHIPMAGSGRGFELGLLRMSGRFDQAEIWDVTAGGPKFVTQDVPFRAVYFQVGWSGPFTGASLPWR